MKDFLSNGQRVDLKRQHRGERERRHADRIKAILLLDKGWCYEQVAEALLLDDSTIRDYENRFLGGGVKELVEDGYRGKESKLTVEQEVGLVKHLTEQLFHTTKEIVAYVEQTFGVVYKIGGMLHLLHRLGFSYKKTKIIPGKADPEKQEEFLQHYEELKNGLKPGDKIYFMDGCHPHHNPEPAYAWVRTGTEKEICSNTGRQRININGALNVQEQELIFRTDDSINGQSTIELLKQIEVRNPDAESIFIIADNARYYRSRLVQDFLETSRVQIIFLPPYAPNLNLIERFWKFFHKNILYNRYFETFQQFKQQALEFLGDLSRYGPELHSLLAENFQIIGRNTSGSL